MKSIKFDYMEYEIQLIGDSSYSLNSTDNKIRYKNEIGELKEFHPVTKIGIIVNKNEIEVNSAILFGYGGASGLHQNSSMLENDKIFICIGDSVMCLSLPDLKLIWQTKLDNATCFEIFKFLDDFIIHGELSISRINPDGKVKWNFYGSDIFTEEFKIIDNNIYATDFNHDLFKIDINTGKEIKT